MEDPNQKTPLDTSGGNLQVGHEDSTMMGASGSEREEDTSQKEDKKFLGWEKNLSISSSII